MRMNRRNVLVGLGTIVAGGGAAIGTGAFSSVEATRDVNIETTGDASALLALEVLSDTLSGDSSDQMEIDVSDLNKDATTIFEEAIRIQNNGNDPVDVTATGDLPSGMILKDPNGNAITSPISLTSSEEMKLDVEFDTSVSGWSDTTDGTITITATAQSE